MIQTDIIAETISRSDSLLQQVQNFANHPLADATPWNAWTLCQAGEYFMIPLIVLLLIAIYLVIERGIFICGGARLDNTFLQRVKDYVHDNEIESADNLCRKNNTPASRTVAKGLALLGRPMADIYDYMTLHASIEISTLSKNLKTLAFIAAGAPMLGLAGTFIGMLRAAFDMASGNGFSPSALLMPFATFVAGLLIGFVALAAYLFLVSKMNRLKLTLNTTIARFLDILNEPA